MPIHVWVVSSALFWDIGTSEKHGNQKAPESARLAGKSLIEYLGVFCPIPYIKITILEPKSFFPNLYNYMNFYRDPLRGGPIGDNGTSEKTTELMDVMPLSELLTCSIGFHEQSEGTHGLDTRWARLPPMGHQAAN